MSQLTQQIHELFAQVLHLTDAFDDDTPFIELGGQSILMGELKSRMEQMFQVDIPFDVMFAQGTVSGLARQVEKSRNNVITGSRDADFSVDPACRFQPCPMTDLQTAYYSAGRRTRSWVAVPPGAIRRSSVPSTIKNG